MSGKHSHEVTFTVDGHMFSVRLIVNPDDVSSTLVSVRHNRSDLTGWHDVEPEDVQVVSTKIHSRQPFKDYSRSL